MAPIPLYKSADVIYGRCVRSPRRVDRTARILMQMYDDRVYVSLFAFSFVLPSLGETSKMFRAPQRVRLYLIRANFTH